MPTKKKESRYSWLLFFVPLLILSLAVAVPLISDSLGGNQGRLDVVATAYPYHESPISLIVQAEVNGTIVTTPDVLHLVAGYYAVEFPVQDGYTSPATKTAVVPAGVTATVVGSYYPIKKVIGFTEGYTNATRVSAIHGVTPVSWLNLSSQAVTLQSDFFGQLPIQPGENATMVFSQPGSYTWWVYTDKNVTGLITVS
ncbi:MAG TPA: hypothetical protein VEJ36_08190 [Nitrososphaerales archaeon]|nr:hypothetical protein [Nitrososphaerales archaeon]